MPAERMCVACRERAAPDALVRLVRHPVSGEVIVDLPNKLPGRGAWVHPVASCVADLEAKAGKLARALDGSVRVEGLRQRLMEALHRAAGDGISMAWASGSLVGGHDRLVQEIRNGVVSEVVIASDASERTVNSIRRAAQDVERSVTFVEVPFSRDELGSRTGKGPRAALGVRPTRSSAFLRRQLHRLGNLG